MTLTLTLTLTLKLLGAPALAAGEQPLPRNPFNAALLFAAGPDCS